MYDCCSVMYFCVNYPGAISGTDGSKWLNQGRQPAPITMDNSPQFPSYAQGLLNQVDISPIILISTYDQSANQPVQCTYKFY